VGKGGSVEYSLYEADVMRASSIFGVHANTGEIYLKKPVAGLGKIAFAAAVDSFLLHLEKKPMFTGSP
jgi:hypothetical protein